MNRQLIFIVMLALGQTAAAQEEAAAPESVEDRLARVERELQTLKTQAKARPAGSSHLQLGEVKLRFLGYLDVGFFKAMGDGVAYQFDAGKRRHPEYVDVPWVFDGDPWANPVNSWGDSADLGLDRTNIARVDPIQSGGRPTFLVNTINLGLVVSHGANFLGEVSINFLPRQGRLGSFGDMFDVDLAYVEWIPSTELDLHVFVGKFESVFGIEYRQRKASDRFNITPSIIARYTVGTNTGLKVRGSFFSGALTWAVALTNGGPSTETFSHFYDELDRTFMKTASARVSWKLPIEAFSLELGASGVVGPQDHQPDDRLIGWQVGGDLKLVAGDLTLRAEYVRVTAPGGGIERAPFLRADGFYVDAWYQITGLVGVYARLDYRGADLFADTNLYLGRVGRATVGARLDLNFHVAAKVEYLRVQELSGPEINDDVFTSSLVLKF